MRLGILIGVGTLVAAAGVFAWLHGSGAGNGAASETRAATAGDAKREMRIVLSNIRANEAADGENAWAKRSDLLIGQILASDPDVIAVQEAMPVQRADLIARMPAYGVYPDGRDEESGLAALKGILNFTAIFYRKERFEIIDSASGKVREAARGDPQTTAYYSMVVLKDKSGELPTTVVIDTHLRHDVKVATEDAKLLNNIVTAQLRLHKGAEAIVLGDMNFDKSTSVYRALLGEEASFPSGTPRTQLRDTYDYAAKKEGEKWGSWHAFTGKPMAEWPSDLILVSAGWKAGKEEVVREGKEGRFGSDHWVVRETVGR
jgi:endonuclease/exonuclease/phosphatase family metal-dependent hydrolase